MKGSSAFSPLRVFLVSWRPLVPDTLSSSWVTGNPSQTQCLPSLSVFAVTAFKGYLAPACFALHFLDSDGFTLVQISWVLFCPFKGTCVKNNSLGQRFLEAERAEPGHPEAHPGAACSE